MEKKLESTISKHVKIYFPIINYSECSGTLNLDKSKFDNLIKCFLERYRKYEKSSIVYYNYLDITYTIKNCRQRSIYKTNYTNIYKNDRIMMLTYDEIKIDNDKFPIIDIYHNICKKNRMEFNNDNIKISLVTETYSDNTVYYYPEISFLNNEIDYNTIKETIDYIVDMLF